MEKLRILLVDDHRVVREGVRFILTTQSAFETKIDEAENAEMAFLKASHNNYDVILMDINLGKSSGVDVTSRIMQIKPRTKVIALSMHDESFRIKQMLNAGAKGYLLKNTGKEEIIKAVKTVQNGERYYSNEIALMLLEDKNRIGQNSRGRKRKSVGGISKRELQVLKLISDEMTNDEIAQELNISKRTVDSHRQQMLVKLGLKNTAGLVRYAIENGLLEETI